jgi:hypothetical protein
MFMTLEQYLHLLIHNRQYISFDKFCIYKFNTVAGGYQ